MWRNQKYTPQELLALFTPAAEPPVDAVLFGPVFSDETFCPALMEPISPQEDKQEGAPGRGAAAQQESEIIRLSIPTVATEKRPEVENENEESREEIHEIMLNRRQQISEPPQASTVNQPILPSKESTTPVAVFAPVRLGEGFLPPKVQQPDPERESLILQRLRQKIAMDTDSSDASDEWEEIKQAAKKKIKKVKKIKKTTKTQKPEPSTATKTHSLYQAEPKPQVAVPKQIVQTPVSQQTTEKKEVEVVFIEPKVRILTEEEMLMRQPLPKSKGVIKMAEIPAFDVILEQAEKEKDAQEEKKPAPPTRVSYAHNMPEDEHVGKEAQPKRKKRKRIIAETRPVITKEVQPYAGGEEEDEDDFVLNGTLLKSKRQMLIEEEKDFIEHPVFFGTTPIPDFYEIDSRNDRKTNKIAADNIVGAVHEIKIEKPAHLIEGPREKISPIPWMIRELKKHIEVQDAEEIAQAIAMKSKEKMVQALSVVLFSQEKAQLIADKFFHQFTARN